MIKLPDNFKQYEEDEHKKEETIENKKEESSVNESENSLTGLVLKGINKVNFLNYEVRFVDILNRRFKAFSFLSEVEANDYISKNPLYEILTIDEVYWNLAPSDYDGVEIEFVPYEFKKYPDYINNLTSNEVKKYNNKVIWIVDEIDKKRK